MGPTLEERASNVPRSDYLRAYALLEGEERAAAIVAAVFDRLTEYPDDDLVLDPKFVALLALFSDPGRILADALQTPDETLTMQRELAREHENVRAAFPLLLTRRRRRRSP